jgi:hypothetical protein
MNKLGYESFYSNQDYHIVNGKDPSNTHELSV